MLHLITSPPPLRERGGETEKTEGESEGPRGCAMSRLPVETAVLISCQFVICFGDMISWIPVSN